MSSNKTADEEIAWRWKKDIQQAKKKGIINNKGEIVIATEKPFKKRKEIG